MPQPYSHTTYMYVHCTQGVELLLLTIPLQFLDEDKDGIVNADDFHKLPIHNGVIHSPSPRNGIVKEHSNGVPAAVKMDFGRFCPFECHDTYMHIL